MKKYLVSFSLAVVFLLSLSLAFATDDQGEYKGIRWSFINDTLSFEGEGLIPSFDTPWNEYYQQTKVLSIGEGIYGLEYWAEFDHMPKLEKIIFATDNFDEMFVMSEKIKEVVFLGEKPEFKGMDFCYSRLEKILFENAEDQYIQEGNFLFNNDRTELVYYFGSKKEKVVIPDNITTIREGAFANSNIVSIVLPSTLQEIQHGAFIRCAKIKTIEIPASCKIIGPSAISSCNSLSKIVFCGENIELRGYYYIHGEKIVEGFTFAFNPALKAIELPGCEEIPGSLFMNCSNLKKVVFGEGTKRIQSGQTFTGCKKLQYIYVPDDMEIDNKFIVGNGDEPPKKAIICCHAGSKAEELAIKYNLKYKIIK